MLVVNDTSDGGLGFSSDRAGETLYLAIWGFVLAAGILASRHRMGDMVRSLGLWVLVILVLLSAVSSNVLMAPRVLFAMASDGLFWRGAREVNRGGTPDIALLISSLLAATFIIGNGRSRRPRLKLNATV